MPLFRRCLTISWPYLACSNVGQGGRARGAELLLESVVGGTQIGRYSFLETTGDGGDGEGVRVTVADPQAGRSEAA